MPGDNCPYIHAFSPATQQVLCLVGNAWTNATRLPKNLLKQCAAFWPSAAGSSRCSKEVGFASSILGLSAHTVRSWIENLKKTNWMPIQRQSLADWNRQRRVPALGATLEDPPASGHEAEEDNATVLARVVRRASLCCFENRTGLEYERDMESLSQLCPGVFGTHVIHIAAATMRHLDSLDLAIPLGGLGIPSDLSLMLDPVSLGFGKFPKHETCLVLCLCSVSPHTYRLRTMMMDAPTMGLSGHTGESIATLALDTLREHACGFGLAALRSRLGSLCGDGALCKGGPDAQHGSTGALEEIWQRLHPGTPDHCCTWDSFLPMFFFGARLEDYRL